jgi:hypothetical protein
LSRRKRAHRRTELLNVLWEKILRQEGVEEGRIHLRIFTGLLNTHKDSARRLLEQRTRKVFLFSICGEGKTENP